MNQEKQEQYSSLVVLEQGSIKTYGLLPGKEFCIGRYDPIRQSTMPEIPLHSGIASRRHGTLREICGKWYYTEEPSNQNGTFLNGGKLHKNRFGRKRPVVLTHGNILRIDSEQFGHPQIVSLLFVEKDTGRPWRYFPLTTDADTLLPDGSSSITGLNGGFFLTAEDGVFRNGVPFSGTVQLSEGDRIGLRTVELHFLGTGFLYQESV